MKELPLLTPLNCKAFSLTPYIDQQSHSIIKTHKYSGADLGFAYIYFYSPLGNFLVDHVLPPWLA
jgi:hypothetical protein